MNYNNGVENITTELLHWDGDGIAKKVFDFGKHAEFYTTGNVEYDPNNPVCQEMIKDVIEGRTFPKFAFEGCRVGFKVNKISRICLAQFTREQGIFCSESSATHPLTNDMIIPKNIYQNPEWMARIKKLFYDLEGLYIDMAEAGIPYMDARYIMPHAQTISLSYSAPVMNFLRSCASRTRNDFCDEINHVYRSMRLNLLKAIETLKDPLSKQLWNWLMEKSINTKWITPNYTYGVNMERYPAPEGFVERETPHNDYTKSSWMRELIYYYKERPEMLLPNEKEMVEKWLKVYYSDGELEYENTFNPDDPKALQNAIKNTDYYKEHLFTSVYEED